MKSIARKLLAFSFVIALTAGCSSVTSSKLADKPAKENIHQVKPGKGNVQAGGEDYEIIYDKPHM